MAIEDAELVNDTPAEILVAGGCQIDPAVIRSRALDQLENLFAIGESARLQIDAAGNEVLENRLSLESQRNTSQEISWAPDRQI